jgi:hypothetical protein
LCQRHTRRVFEAAARNNTLFCKRYILIRRASFNTLSALFAKTGGEAMETFITYPRFYYGSDPSVQEYEYNFHFHAGTGVKRPELLYWADHVQIVGYNGGWGVRPYAPSMMSDARNVLSSGATSPYHVFIYEEPYEAIEYPAQISITGRREDYYPYVNNNALVTASTANYSHMFANAYAANLLYLWFDQRRELESDETMVARERPHLSELQNHFPMCHRGTARFYSVKARTQWITVSKGYFPSDIVTTRMGDVLRGAMEMFPREDLSGFIPVAA